MGQGKNDGFLAACAVLHRRISVGPAGFVRLPTHVDFLNFRKSIRRNNTRFFSISKHLPTLLKKFYNSTFDFIEHDLR
jgi:hypothetical protein